MKIGKKIRQLFSPISKIDPRDIINGHLATLYDASSTEMDKHKNRGKDYLFFFGVPALISILLIILYPTISTTLGNIITTVFTIFISLLLSLLVLLYSMFTSNLQSHPKYTIIIKTLKQTVANVSFLIFISILSLFVMILCTIITPDVAVGGVLLNQVMCGISLFLTLIMYYLLCLSGLTILMVLKRMYLLISSSIENIM